MGEIRLCVRSSLPPLLYLALAPRCNASEPHPCARTSCSYPNEIIEWPVVLLQWQRSTPGNLRDQDDEEDDDDDDEDESDWHLVQVDEFHSFVKPTWANRLSSFCTELTGITQVSRVCARECTKTAVDRLRLILLFDRDREPTGRSRYGAHLSRTVRPVLPRLYPTT